MMKSQSAQIFLERRKYIFLLLIFFILIIVLAIINPLHLFTNYLYVTLPIILFFLSFIISMLFLYNRDPSDLTPININIPSRFLMSLSFLIKLGTLVAFVYWIITAFDVKSFDDLAKNTHGNKFAVTFNIAMIVGIFIVSLLNLGTGGRFSLIILSVLSVLFLILFIVFKVTDSDGSKFIKTPIIFFYCIISIGLFLISSNSKDFLIATTNEEIINGYFLKALMFLFGSGISALFIYWIIVTIGKLDKSSSIISFILNILIVITILGLAYKALSVGNFFKSSPAVSLAINILLYIPCVFVNIIERLSGFGGRPSTSLKNENSIGYIVAALLLLAIYFSVPYIKNRNVLQGGKQLLNEPVYSNSERVLSTYGKLNDSDNFNYRYAISFWFYIDSSPSTSKYVSLLNYGNKPNVKYNSTTNTLMIVEDQKGGPYTDENGMRIIYKKTGVLLQKWNNIIINYTGGTLDIFYNGSLVKSSIEVIPYMKLDNLTIGQNDGLHGGICNVIYFKNPLNASQIYYVYHSVKNKTPPSLYESNENILRDQFNLAGEGDEIVNSNIVNIKK